MKIYINSAKENWVVDRFIEEWDTHNQKKSKNYIFGKKIIWLIAPWTWTKVPTKYLSKNKVLCTIHHIDENKFEEKARKEFIERDKYVDHYHVISNKTFDQVKKLTDKPITTIPFWVNQNLWYEIPDKDELRQKFQIDKSSFLIGSFQRDTEGSDLVSPKLSKGPDQFVEILEHFKNEKENLVVVLTGKRRNYIINNLKEKKIDYKYYEMTSFQELNELYNILDLYVVSSRYEGGPQSIVESAIIKTPIISTDVGIASEVLAKKSIFNMKNFKNAVPDIETAFNNSLKYKIPNGFEKFNKLFESLSES
tara:strand:+ start:20265 stop:21188 length:924 start_codon:yes stop_codon:yes gene_type:complete